MTEAQRADASAQARALLGSQPRWQKAKTILFFAPLPGELDVWPMLGEALGGGKRVFLPRFVEGGGKPKQRPEVRGQRSEARGPGTTKQPGRYVVCEVSDLDKDLRLGQFGIREPASHCLELSLNRLDLTLVPAVAFDLHGRRLGRGKGFYDQLLAVVRGTTCGVAFDQQIVGEIPVEPHDVHVNCILTPTRWIEL